LENGRQIRGLKLFLIGILLTMPSLASASGTPLDLSQYAHTAWKFRDGFTKSPITSIAQTPDGYLWLGTELGLVRFDGVRAVPWEPPNGQLLPSNYVRMLLVSRDGTLWIATLKGLASWKEGKLAQYADVAGQAVGSLYEDREGKIWFGTSGPGRLCAIQAGKVQCYGEGDFGLGVNGLFQDHDGTLWMATQTGVWRWTHGPPLRYPLPQGVTEANSLAEDAKEGLLVATNDGLKHLVDGKIQSYALPGLSGKFRPTSFLRSRDGGLWITSFQGLLHWNQNRVDVFGMSDGLSGDTALSIFEDREGSVWVATRTGLDRFREYAVPTISTGQGLSSSTAWSVQATADESIWIGTTQGLNRWANGQMTVFGRRSGTGPSGRTDEGRLNVARTITEVPESGFIGMPRSLGLDDRGRLWVASSEGVFYFENNRFIRLPEVAIGSASAEIVGDGHGKVWISGNDGLAHVAPGDVPQSIPWSQLGHSGFGAAALLPDRSQGGMWLGFFEGGLVYFKDGQARASYSSTDGLGHGTVGHLRFDSSRTLWAATESGLSRVKDGHIETLTRSNGLPCDQVLWSLEDDNDALWVHMPCGLARIEAAELSKWKADPRYVLKITTLDSADGVPSVGRYFGYGPHVSKSPDGRIWVVASDGISVLDPRHLAFNKVLPPVHVEEVTADGKNYDASGGLRLPPLIRDLTINYTALSLAAPEKVRFRYKLEGQDKDWKEVVNLRQVQYSNLPPKSYRFRVTACNNSGVWNETGAFLDFSIAPAFYQTTWFIALCVAAVLALLWSLYQYRLHEIQKQFNISFEARESERLRIARDLHDTLLQSFQGVLLRFQAASNLFATNPKEAKEKLDHAIDLAAQAVTEGRVAVQGLRSSATVTNELAKELSELTKELAGNGHIQNSPAFTLHVEGEPRNLHPLLRDEVYRIAGEALRNAFRHSQAQHIEAELRYNADELRLRIRDDGKGIAREVIEDDGRAGHWGLHGMRERAKIIGGNLEVWSSAQSGTEVELTIPARVAYATMSRPRTWFSGKGNARKT
jgi:signal transduction histidine kinase/ligand-binding sensor domain-containing protein